MSVRDDEATSRTHNYLITYNALLCKNTVDCVTEDNPKIAVRHVTSAVQPVTLRTRLQSDLSPGYKPLKNDFTAFMQHCLKLVDAFQLLDVEPAPGNPKNDAESKALFSARSTLSATSSKPKNKQERPRRKCSYCLDEPRKSRAIRHFLKNCKQCPQKEKKHC